jgi:hypothetical protein
VSFPDGLFQFTATGCVGTITVTAIFPTPFAPGAQYYKYGPTPGPVPAHWYALGAANNAALAGNTATFTITDGNLGDDDLAANGTIVDQGGPALVAGPGGNGGNGGNGSVRPAPSLSVVGLAVLAGLIAMLGLVSNARRLRPRTSNKN